MSEKQQAAIGVVGCGWWACFNHIPALLEDPGAEVAALCDPDPARRARVGDEFGVAARYGEVAEMLEAEKLDGVVVASPHVAHFANAAPAVSAGIHALVEKPMTASAAAARALAAKSRETGAQVMVPCGWNFMETSARAAALVGGEKGIGEVRHISCQMASALDDLFAGKPMLETADHFFRPPPSTWADPARAGGYGWGQLSHALAWIYYVAAGMRPQSVFALAGQSPAGVDYYDAAAVRMESGATLSLSGAATVPKSAGFQLDIRIFGDDGMLLFDVERERMKLVRHDGRDEAADIPPGGCAYDGKLPVRRFVELCRGARVENPADAEVGARVVETLDALYRSAKSGKEEKAQ